MALLQVSPARFRRDAGGSSMTTLLVLGSKPEPILPESAAYNEVACANASGRSACRHGLPIPRFTVVSAIVTSGRKPANDLAVFKLVGS
jgi:hypothetical protein